MINEEFAKIFREYGFTHPELSELKFSTCKNIRFVGVMGKNEKVTEYVNSVIQDDEIFIDASYNNIYEDFLKCSYIDDKVKKYFKHLVDKASEGEINLLIDQVFITPIMKESTLDANVVYVRVSSGMILPKFKELIRLE